MFLVNLWFKEKIKQLAFNDLATQYTLMIG